MSDADALGAILKSIRALADAMEGDLNAPGSWSRDAWIRAYDDRLSHLKRVLKWADEHKDAAARGGGRG